MKKIVLILLFLSAVVLLFTGCPAETTTDPTTTEPTTTEPTTKEKITKDQLIERECIILCVNC